MKARIRPWTLTPTPPSTRATSQTTTGTWTAGRTSSCPTTRTTSPARTRPTSATTRSDARRQTMDTNDKDRDDAIVAAGLQELAQLGAQEVSKQELNMHRSFDVAGLSACVIVDDDDPRVYARIGVSS